MAEKKPLILTSTAQKQRLEILQYWYNRLGNSRYSELLANGFEHCLDMISQYPEIGRKIEDTVHRGFTFKSYLIIYQNLTNEIVIHQFWDLRQDPETLVLS